jgi:molybdenum cofactor cytidylyltransferase
MAERTTLPLLQALRAGPSPKIAIVGAGGKTTLLFKLAAEFPGPVLISTTAHFGRWQLKTVDQRIFLDEDVDLNPQALEIHNAKLISITGKPTVDKRVSHLNERALEQLKMFAESHGLPLLIEADGSKQKPIKAPNATEPVIPEWVDIVCVVAGMEALGKPNNEEFVHRPERFKDLTGCELGQEIDSSHMVKLLSDKEGGLKDIPEHAQRIAILNQADNLAIQAQARPIAEELLSIYDMVLVTKLKGKLNGVKQAYQRIAGVILAGGASRRYGQPKQLLTWKGKPFIRWCVEASIQAGLDPVIVVLGANAEAIRPALADLPVKIVDNPDWNEGQASSLRVGVQSLPSETGAAIFLLADQPQVTPDLLNKMKSEHALSLANIIAPTIAGQRTTPTLFDQSTFTQLQQLQGDSGGRQLFSQYPPHYFEYNDRRLLFDIDQPEDYQHFLRMMENGQ